MKENRQITKKNTILTIIQPRDKTSKILYELLQVKEQKNC